MSMTTLGFLMVAVVTFLVLTNRVNLVIVFSVVPIIFALLGKFSPLDIGNFVTSGVNSTFTAVVLILFAVAFFSLLSETCMFDVMVNAILKVSKSNRLVILLSTVVIAFIAHLDGSFNTTYLITIPALLPLYKKLGIDKKYLLLLTVLAAVPMTALPWSSVAVMVATFAEINPVVMWKALLPMQAAGLVFCVLVAFFIEFVTYKGKANAAVQSADSESQIDFSKRPLARPKFFWINFLIFIGCIVALLFVKLPTYLIFMLFFDITLLINYPQTQIQKQLINKYCPTMLNPCLIFLAIGVMVGVMKDSGMVKGMIDALLTLIPASAAKYTHVIMAIFSVPILVVIPYQLFYSIFPILIGIAANFGISPMASIMVFTLLYGSQCSPMVAAANLCAELGETEITVHCRNLFFPVWLACIVSVLAGVISGGMFL
ncbi:MAG: hypothetical protein LBQ42_12010 [Synergistaceae bacterium]|jgi:CitMHS family citrate-Mg2+:H+ or citrate-Ca2+:H+ symporter|nr:hypothetical protein [Synergistaceae bacterium]